MNVTLCMMVLLVELDPFIPLSVTLHFNLDHSSVKLKMKMLCSYLIKLKLSTVVNYIFWSSRSWIYIIPLFFIFGENWPRLKKNFNIGFFLDIIKARSFKLCMIITLLRVYNFTVGLMTLILCQDHRCVSNVNCKK